MITISDTFTEFPDPSFVLCRPHGTVAASGIEDVFGTAQEAMRALRGGQARHIVGPLPFAPGARAALWAPKSFSSSEGRYRPRTITAPTFEFDAAVPSPQTHVQRVADAVRLLADPSHPIRKVVLARAVRARSGSSVRPREVLDALVSTDPMGNGFLVDLSAAGAPYRGRHLLGSSPEVLVRRESTEVLSHPLAGSAGRVLGDDRADRAVALELLASAKDQHEHGYVVDHVGAVLRNRCDQVHTPAAELTATPEMWHIGTPITARVPEAGPSALELAAALHPTPAICGTPTAAAAHLIAELEGDRGFYAGAVGWCDADGHGEWMVSIRCAELSADGRGLLAHAGGGIVAESDPLAELAETTGKFQRIMRPLGITDLKLVA